MVLPVPTSSAIQEALVGRLQHLLDGQELMVVEVSARGFVG